MCRDGRAMLLAVFYYYNPTIQMHHNRSHGPIAACFYPSAWLSAAPMAAQNPRILDLRGLNTRSRQGTDE